MNDTLKPDLAAMRRVEELLREELHALGVDVAALPPHEISRNMTCAVHSSGALSYAWQGRPLLDVEPEAVDGGGVRWRFFTREVPLQ